MMTAPRLVESVDNANSIVCVNEPGFNATLAHGYGLPLLGAIVAMLQLEGKKRRSL